MRLFRLSLQILGFLTLLGIAACSAGLPFLGGWLHRQDALQKSDFIIPLAGGSDRVVYAIDLYHQGFGPKLLFGLDELEPQSEELKRVMKGIGLSEVDPAEFVSRSLRFLKVPAEASAVYGMRLVSTIDEAEALRRFIGGRKFSAILVTSAYHTRRAKMIFEHVLPNGRFLIVAPPGDNNDGWWRTQRSAVRTLNESAKLIFFLAGGAFRRADNAP